MHFRNFVFLCALFWVSLPVSVYGQENDPPVQIDDVKIVIEPTKKEMTQLTNWIEDELYYWDWYSRLGNRVDVRKQRRPKAPIWLKEKCDSLYLFSENQILQQACDLFRKNPQELSVSDLSQQIAVAQRNAKEETATRFIDKVHIGGGYPVLNGGNDFGKWWGVLEMHVSIKKSRRMEWNLPGFILLSVPNLKGERETRIGTTTGLGFTLGDFEAPGMNQSFTLHFNVAEAWALSGLGPMNHMSIAGFSITTKK